MGETSNTSKIAELAFESIFGVFGWQRTGPVNTEWPCQTKHKTGGPKNEKKPTHPTDAVYFYDDPYEPHRIYVNIDFKSYAKSSIESMDLAGALHSLSNTIECANKSNDYQERFCESEAGEIVGLLFVYNHDNVYDPSKFRSALVRVNKDALDTAKGRRLFIMGPDDISYLLTVSNDIRNTAGTSHLKNHERTFFYPDLVGYPARQQAALSLESMMGPWQVVRLIGAKNNIPDNHYYIYCRSKGATVPEFEYLFDSFFRFQMLEQHTTIHVRPYSPDKNASVNFDNAKERYVCRLHNLAEIRTRLNNIEFSSLKVVHQEFSDLEIGMHRG